MRTFTLVKSAALAACVLGPALTFAASASLDANMGIEANLDAANATAPASGSAMEQGSMDASMNMSGSGDANAPHTGAAAQLSTGASLDLTRASVESDASTGAMNSEAVSTDDDLSAYAKSTIASDDNVERITAASDSVAVSYREPARLFGFIPMHIPATADADASGAVRIHYPWYRFLVATNSADLQSSVESRVHASLAGNAKVSGGFSASDRARVIAALHSALQAEADASLNADAAAAAKP